MRYITSTGALLFSDFGVLGEGIKSLHFVR